MKKHLLFKSLLLLCALVVGTNAWAADVVGTINFGSASGSTNVNSASVSGNDSQGNTWTVTTAGTTSFTPNASYAQIGSSSKPATSITFTTTLASAQTIKAFSAKFGGFSGTQGTVTLKVGDTTVGTGSLNATTDVTVSATNTTTSGTVLTVTVTGISKGVKAYFISYTYGNDTPTHTLTYSAENGSIAGVGAGSITVASGASVAEGGTVSLTATPSTGYRFSSWNVSGTGSTLTSTSTNPTTFTMGTADATVTATFEEVVAIPTFDPDGSATYTEAQNVAISCATGGATIHYTTNGDDPTESDPTYSSPVSITTSETVLKAKAFKDGMPASDVASATYTIKPNKPTVTAVGPTVTITGDDGLEFYYTTDGSTPTNSSTHYTGSFNLNADCTIKARAYDSYSNASDVFPFTYKYFPLIPKNINSGYYVKVTDVSDLENGDAILVVYEDEEFAMSTTQNNNNRGSESVSISNSTINSPSASVQKLVLVKNTEEIESTPTDVYYFYTGSGYLYAASSSSNYLRTEDTPDGNARATISISNEDATITFTGSNTHNILKFNNASNQKIFSCYGSGQQAVQIYKEVAHNETLSPAKQYTTLTSAYNLNFTDVTGLKAYIATTISDKKVQMIQVNKVPAGTGLVLKATTPGSAVNVPVFDGTGADDVSGNNMVGSATATTDIAANGGYILKDGVFQPATAGTLAAGKAYLAIAVSGARALEMSFEDDVTAIEAVKAQNVENGQYFNLAGQRVANPTKGLYIVNGKKVIIK
jgi:hypothetical protein